MSYPGLEGGLSSADLEADGKGKGKGKAIRSDWVDIAKCISISLVVFWHVFQLELYLNYILLFLRMPLFFMIAGFFAAKSLKSSMFMILRDKFMNFLYLYLLWRFINYFTYIVPKNMISDSEITFYEYVYNSIFVIEGYWFFLGLAFVFPIAKVLSRFDHRIVIGILLVIYCLSVYDGQWDPVNFPTRMARLSLMFMVGTFIYTWLDTVSLRYRLLWPVTVVLFLLIGHLVWALGLQWFAPVTLLASAAGIIGVAQFSQAVAGTRLGNAFVFLGSRTIYIYALHGILLPYFDTALGLLGFPAGLMRKAVLFVLLLPTSLLLGIVLDRFLPWLFKAPWLIKARAMRSALAA